MASVPFVTTIRHEPWRRYQFRSTRRHQGLGRFIAIISPNYASSRWGPEAGGTCQVCKCRRLILPVFYQLDPSDVRRQGGRFHEHFGKLEARSGEDKVLRWRKATEKVGGVAGWVFDGSSDEEPNLIQKLVNRILAQLNNTPLSVAANTVGLESQLEELLNLLDLKSNFVRVLGFHELGWVRKATLATVLVTIRRIIHEKQVLVVEDVDDASQLEVVIGKRKWRQCFYGEVE